MKTIVCAAVVLLMTAATARAQGPLARDAARIAHDMVIHQDAVARSGIDDVITPTWFTISEFVFVGGQLTDSITAIVFLRRTDAVGRRIYSEANPVLPDDLVAIVGAKVAATAAGVALAKKMYDDGHKWEAVAIMAAAGLISFASGVNNLVQAYPAGTIYSGRTAMPRGFTIRW